MGSIPCIKETLYRFCDALGIPPAEYPLIDKGAPVRDGIYFSDTPNASFRVVERGKTLFQKECTSVDELYYGILRELSFEIAMRAEAKQRKEAEDPRRQLFALQYELLKKLDDKFGQWYLSDVSKLLEEQPFSDEKF